MKPKVSYQPCSLRCVVLLPFFYVFMFCIALPPFFFKFHVISLFLHLHWWWQITQLVTVHIPPWKRDQVSNSPLMFRNKDIYVHILLLYSFSSASPQYLKCRLVKLWGYLTECSRLALIIGLHIHIIFVATFVATQRDTSLTCLQLIVCRITWSRFACQDFQREKDSISGFLSWTQRTWF
jgi:hypothetical protein